MHIDVDITDEQSLNIDQLRARWRLQSSYGVTERLRIRARLAGLCSSDECQPDLYFEPEIPTPVGIEDGQITLDELFLHWFRTQRFDLAVGRLQTKFVTRGGVFAKSLDRNDSNNLRINWTDAGWLLSPQYGKNEKLFEIRYLWRRNQRHAVDIRGRWRKDMEPIFNGLEREEFDFYLRFTWGLSGREF